LSGRASFFARRRGQGVESKNLLMLAPFSIAGARIEDSVRPTSRDRRRAMRPRTAPRPASAGGAGGSSTGGRRPRSGIMPARHSRDPRRPHGSACRVRRSVPASVRLRGSQVGFWTWPVDRGTGRRSAHPPSRRPRWSRHLPCAPPPAPECDGPLSRTVLRPRGRIRRVNLQASAGKGEARCERVCRSGEDVRPSWPVRSEATADAIGRSRQRDQFCTVFHRAAAARLRPRAPADRHVGPRRFTARHGMSPRDDRGAGS
jgi:hypothetical protein